MRLLLVLMLQGCAVLQPCPAVPASVARGAGGQAFFVFSAEDLASLIDQATAVALGHCYIAKQEAES